MDDVRKLDRECRSGIGGYGRLRGDGGQDRRRCGDDRPDRHGADRRPAHRECQRAELSLRHRYADEAGQRQSLQLQAGQRQRREASRRNRHRVRGPERPDHRRLLASERGRGQDQELQRLLCDLQRLDLRDARFGKDQPVRVDGQPCGGTAAFLRRRRLSRRHAYFHVR